MPVLDIFLVLFPTEKNFLAVLERREINQSALQVLDFNFTRLKLAQNLAQAGRVSQGITHRFASYVRAVREQGLQALVMLNRAQAERFHLVQPSPHLGQKFASFLHGIMFFKAKGHQREEEGGIFLRT